MHMKALLDSHLLKINHKIIQQQKADYLHTFHCTYVPICYTLEACHWKLQSHCRNMPLSTNGITC